MSSAATSDESDAEKELSTPSPAKKPRKTNNRQQRRKNSSNDPPADLFADHRLSTAASVLDFPFRKSRVRLLRPHVSEVAEHCPDGILYWMSRDARVQDNWALLYAQKLALKTRLPLHVCYILHDRIFPTATATRRHYSFLLHGLCPVAEECARLNIAFHLIDASTDGNDVALLAFVWARQFGCMVCDFWPLREPRQRLANVVDGLPAAMAVCQVDAHNIVPVWTTSDKQEYAARTIRTKVNGKLADFLQPFPPVIRHPHDAGATKPAKLKHNWSALLASRRCDHSVTEVEWARPGPVAGMQELRAFCEQRLPRFAAERNDPLAGVLSNLSPWLRFGQLSAQRCVLEVRRHLAKHAASVAAYCEEMVVRRELSENFCYYNEHYDSLDGLSGWARETLLAHKKDKRDWLYDRGQLELAHTHDDLWNAAQLQLVNEGKMHGFMRMYWAKKILEWSKGPDVALADAIYLNDKYSLDGYSPNGFVGCMWSIGGVHDMGWKERPIFGKIRYMNYAGCKRKFDVAAYVARHGGKVYGGAGIKGDKK